MNVKSCMQQLLLLVELSLAVVSHERICCKFISRAMPHEFNDGNFACVSIAVAMRFPRSCVVEPIKATAVPIVKTEAMLVCT